VYFSSKIFFKTLHNNTYKSDVLKNMTKVLYIFVRYDLIFLMMPDSYRPFLYTILLLGFISTQCLIDMTPITD
jgi:hypothetical protein